MAAASTSQRSDIIYPSLEDAGAVFRFGLAALDHDLDNHTITWMQDAAHRHANDARIWQVLALAYREAGFQERAVQAFDTASRLEPLNFRIALGRAQSACEAGLPADELYQSALTLAKDRQTVIPGMVAALCASGRNTAALQLIEEQLRIEPEWLDGHWLFARINWIGGNPGQILDSVYIALALKPTHPGLLRLRTAILLASEQYEAALGAAVEAGRLLNDEASTRFDTAVCLSETWQLSNAEILFRSLPPLDDPATAVHLIRHLLRSGRPELVEAIAFALASADTGKILQPYLSLAWRCLTDESWQALDSPDDTVGVYDLSTRLADHDKLSDLLRTIHHRGFAPMEQSLRGGTQTEGRLLSRIEPEIFGLRMLLEDIVKRHALLVSQRSESHPEFGPQISGTPRFAGSWSVRLQGGGHHISHTHPGGWLSSVLYLHLPDETGDDNSGCLTLGAPPPNLGLKLAPIRIIKPETGHLVLFPSTLWHGTLPFQSGERLTIAFDIARPRPTASNFVAHS